MKHPFVCILFVLFCLLMAGCGTEEPAFTLSRDDFSNVSPEGENFTIEIRTIGSWTATSLNDDWCTVYPSSGTGDGIIRIEVEGNLEADRTGKVVILCENERSEINITQTALPAGEELTYRIPVIFHVLYKDPMDRYQYISASRIRQVLANVNDFYDGKPRWTGGDTPQDINLEFVLAETDEEGNELETPGVEYVQWNQMPIDCVSFMNSTEKRVLDLMWDMNKYINIVLYNFKDYNDGSVTMGISHLPLSTQGANYLEGLISVEYTHLENSNLIYPQCVSINSLYFYEDTDPGYYNTADVNVTLAHELGHYLGLHHAFNEDEQGGLVRDCEDTDYCEDTPPYNRYAYSLWLGDFYANPEGLTEEAFQREDCNTGETFLSYNLMDYEISFSDRFTPNQRARMRHVLEYSPLIPGAKRISSTTTRMAPQGVLDIPVIYRKCTCRLVKGQ